MYLFLVFLAISSCAATASQWTEISTAATSPCSSPPSVLLPRLPPLLPVSICKRSVQLVCSRALKTIMKTQLYRLFFFVVNYIPSSKDRDSNDLQLYNKWELQIYLSLCCLLKKVYPDFFINQNVKMLPFITSVFFWLVWLQKIFTFAQLLGISLLKQCLKCPKNCLPHKYMVNELQLH